MEQQQLQLPPDARSPHKLSQVTGGLRRKYCGSTVLAVIMLLGDSPPYQESQMITPRDLCHHLGNTITECQAIDFYDGVVGRNSSAAP
mmetsp:Transcript_115190/g.229453  ORF Transcript_115190/g.229453 Transcript_115190/m.229453 type:complete len:88 (+) Transcript_115190:33-296(+)